MDVFRIVGGRALSGRARVGGAKNAVLPMLAAAMMTGDAVRIEDCPALTDVSNMLRILETLGCRADAQGGAARLDPSRADRWEMPDHLSKLLRSSIFLLGPLLGRFRKATVTYPGGCEIGLRPIDLHLKGLRALGVRIREEHGMIYCDGSDMRGGEVMLDFPSVGATENVMMAAVLARGKNTINNAAREPEIADLSRVINAMGGRVQGAGTSVLRVTGVDSLHGAIFRPLPDRIVAGTLLAAAAATGGEVFLTNVRACDMDAIFDKLTMMGCELETGADGVSLKAPARLRPVEASTHPYPGFPTDMQAQLMALACLAGGTSVIVENVFENRFAQASQLRRMGARILIDGRAAVIRGGALTGAKVEAGDLRGGAALVLAALGAEGMSEVANAAYVDRGYEALEKTLSDLGANIIRV